MPYLFLFIILTILYIIFYIWLLVKLSRNLWVMDKDDTILEKTGRPNIYEILILCVTPVFGFARYKSYEHQESIPFSETHIDALIILVVISVICYFISKYYKGKWSPVARVIVNTGMLQGLILSFILCIHFGPAMLAGLLLPAFGFELSAPVLVFFLFWTEMYRTHLEFKAGITEPPDPDTFKGRYLNYFNLPFWNSNLFLSFFLVPFFIIEEIIIIIFRQQPDAFYRVFTESYRFTFSDNNPLHHNPAYVRPQPDYLCTIGCHGHPGIVKPLRYGIRTGHPIVVNRQILVANAFECWLEFHTPRLHTHIRRMYDNLGIPLSRWSQNQAIANSIYLMMKPLEWFFTLFLYAVYEKPENEIEKQYLG
jgi:hypothetical protein